MSQKHYKKKINFLEGHNKIENLSDHIFSTHKKKRIVFLVVWKIFWRVALGLIILFLVFSGIALLKYKNLINLGYTGANAMKSAINSAYQKDFSNMLVQSQLASQDFDEVTTGLDQIQNDPIFKITRVGSSEIADLKNIFQGSAALNKSLIGVATIGQEFQNVMSGSAGSNFGQFSVEEKQHLLKTLYEAGPELNGIKANLEIASMDINQISGNGLFFPFKTKINEVKAQLKSIVGFSDQAVIASQIVPAIFGYPQKSTFLVMLENSDELRPTGGFLGTYGILQTSNGDITRFDTHDIYHMDMPLEANKSFNVTPPEPIAKYLNKKWYFRDANWSPDWPRSADQIEWFYKQENSLLTGKNQINNFSDDFTGVIAVTPNFVKSILELVGPVYVNGEEYNKDNFSNFLEYKVEQDFSNQDVSSWQRKEIIGAVLEQVKIKLFNLNYGQWITAFKKLNDNISQKNILTYFNSPALEELAKNLQVGGEIKNVDSDYLMVVDSNMAALKTDSVMDKNISYTLEEKTDGFYAKLKVDYKNNGKKDWRTDDYKSYTRIYLPEGSEITKATGFVYEPAKTYDELGKTVVGGFIIVRLGQSISLNIEYKLPPTLAEKIKSNGYNLYIQKQPGNNIKSLKVDVSSLNKLNSYDPLGAEIKNGKEAIWNSNLDIDREFKINF